MPRPQAAVGSDDDVALVQRARAGDPTVGALLYDRFWPDVNRLVWSLLGADAEHDDVVADAFVAVLAGIHRVRDPSRLRSWVASVTVNTVRTELTRRRLRRRVRPTEDVERLASVCPDQERRVLVRRCLALLERVRTVDRIAFVLRHVEERPLEEVALLCECSLATVKRRIQRAEKRFAALARRDPEIMSRLRRRRPLREDDE